jgi:hypothetical protein
MRQRTTSTATATASASGQGSLLDRYWVGGAAFLRRYSLVLSEAWYDGIYLTAWRRFALWAPLALLLLGLAEGITHATVAFRFTNGASVVEFGLVPFGTQPLFKTDSMQLLVGFTQGQAVAFTELLPLMVLVALAGALSANLGMVLVLGYALGDFLIAGPQIHFLPYGAQGNPLAAFAYQRVPQLVSYALFLLLAVTPTLTAKYLSAPIQRLQGDQRLLWLLRGGAMLLLQGAAVYTWTQAAPLLVRIFWGWINSNPPLTAEYNLQVDGYWLVYAAALAAGLRAVLSYLAYGRSEVAARVRGLASALASAETRQAISRKIPGPIRVLLTAGALTLLLSGFIGGLVEAGIILAFLVVLLLARSLWLPRWGLWNAWARLISRVPVVVRLVVVFFAGNYVGNAIVALWLQPPPWLVSVLQWYAQFNRSGSATFLPVLLSTCLGILIAVALLPSVDEADGESPAAAGAAQPA